MLPEFNKDVEIRRGYADRGLKLVGFELRYISGTVQELTN